jgi:RNA polymerase sigma factor (sigma-70 family)
MAGKRVVDVVRVEVRRLQDMSAPDADLLSRYATDRNEAAFTELVRRHSAMVNGVARRVLSNEQDAEDVCQAVFLLLARKAASLERGSVAGWLCAAARLTALNARKTRTRRIRKEASSRPVHTISPNPLDQMTAAELVSALDDELARLPDRYRGPLVLCYLEGLSRDEAARRLGVATSTLNVQLERGRNRLQAHLAERGIGLGVAVLTVVAAPVAGVAQQRIVESVLSANAEGVVPPGIACLIHGSATTMKLKVVLAAVLFAGALGAVAAVGFGGKAATRNADPPERAQPVTVGLALPARAADLDKLLPDDSNFVLSVNVKQILQSPLFTKDSQKQIEELLKTEAAQAVLKDTAFDPVKDVGRVVLAMGPTSLPEEGRRDDGQTANPFGPVILIQGRFDPDKIRVRIDQAVKDFPDMLKIHSIGKANVVEIAVAGNRYFAVVVDRNIVALAPRREQIEDLLAKAAGERETEFENAELPKLLKALDPKLAIGAVGTSDMVIAPDYSFKPVKYKRLRDSGIKTLSSGATAGDKFRAKVTLTTKNTDSAQKLRSTLEEGLGKIEAEIKAEGELLTREKEKELIATMLDALKSVTLAVKDRTVTLEGHAGADAMQAMIKGWFMVRTRSERPGG